MKRNAAVDVLSRLHDAQNKYYSGGSDESLRRVLTDNVMWTFPGNNSIAGIYRGVDEVLDYFTRRRAIADATFRMQRLDVLVGDGNRIAALTDGRAVINGVERAWSTIGIYDITNGFVAACWLLPLDPATFDNIWSI
jgi:ketosteroid isomerase-like protein